MGFFQESTLISVKEKNKPQCGRCGLIRSCKSPKLRARTKDKDVLIVGEYPSRSDDVNGKHWTGRWYDMLDDLIADAGGDLDDYSLTNAIACNPAKLKDLPKYGEHCYPLIRDQLEDIKPKLIICFGTMATKQVTRWSFGRSVHPESLRYWVHPSQTGNCWIAHLPAMKALEDGEVVMQQMTDRLLRILFNDEKYSDRPFEVVPNYESAIRIATSDEQAIAAIDEYESSGRWIAFDYETDRLKPDHEDSRVISIGIGHTDHATAFRMSPKIRKRWRAFLRSSCGKTACNFKFEERWSRAFFGTRVRNWKWDSMVNAHILDNRPLFTSLKHQAYLLLGQAKYNEHVDRFLEARTSNTRNNVHQIETNQLLIYNGLDALLEALVGEKQRELFNL
jgi:uracil-DNA glycosylase family 4